MCAVDKHEWPLRSVTISLLKHILSRNPLHITLTLGKLNEFIYSKLIKAATIRCGRWLQHLRGIREAIQSQIPQQFVVSNDHSSQKAIR